MSRRGLLLRILALTTTIWLLGACGSSGRNLRDPVPGQTAPPRKQAAAGTVSSTSPSELTVFGIATNDWSLGGEIPTRYTCDGADISPSFAIFVPPPGAVELALVVTDLDNDFVHWIVAGIPPMTVSVNEGEVPPGAVQANNSGGTSQWVGPCPPDGEEHVYEFALYALDTPSGVTAGQDTDSAVAALAAAPLETSTITGSYSRANG